MTSAFSLTVEDVFLVKGRGVVATGRVQTGTLRVGRSGSASLTLAMRSHDVVLLSLRKVG